MDENNNYTSEDYAEALNSLQEIRKATREIYSTQDTDTLTETIKKDIIDSVEDASIKNIPVITFPLKNKKEEK